MNENRGIGFKRKISVSGASLSTTIPKDLCDFLGVKEGSMVRIDGYNGKHGKYLAIWLNED